jgi:hypothetical protein
MNLLKSLVLLSLCSTDPIQACNYTQYTIGDQGCIVSHVVSYPKLFCPVHCQHCVDLILLASLKETPERFLSKFNVPSIIYYPGFYYRGVQTAITVQNFRLFCERAAEHSGGVLLVSL